MDNIKVELNLVVDFKNKKIIFNTIKFKNFKDLLFIR